MENSRNKKAEEEKTVHPTHRNTHSKNEVIEKKNKYSSQFELYV